MRFFPLRKDIMRSFAQKVILHSFALREDVMRVLHRGKLCLSFALMEVVIVFYCSKEGCSAVVKIERDCYWYFGRPVDNTGIFFSARKVL